MAGAAPVGAELAAREQLREHDLDRAASWWHTDGDLAATWRAGGFGARRTALTTASPQRSR